MMGAVVLIILFAGGAVFKKYFWPRLFCTRKDLVAALKKNMIPRSRPDNTE